jgi:hypothetical protein
MLHPFLHSLKEIDSLARHQRDDGLLPIAALADRPAAPFEFALDLLGANLGDVNVENLLYGLLDFNPIGLTIHLESHLIGRLFLDRGLFRDERALDDVVRIHDNSLPSMFLIEDATKTSFLNFKIS